MKRVKMFVLYWVHNGILLYLANQIFPDKFVLGTYKLSLFAAVVLSSLFVTALLEVLSYLAKKRFKLGKLNLFLYFLVGNFAAFWIAARMSSYLGFGVVKFTWVLGLGLLANCIQYAIGRNILK